MSVFAGVDLALAVVVQEIQWPAAVAAADTVAAVAADATFTAVVVTAAAAGPL
ncbi:MAG: hypothetical protein H6563_07465 [Lewinellaceae bacterium]|nr:hypothetical protein [Lewinellaceae bacterium]